MNFGSKELTAEQVDRLLDGVLIGTPKAKDAPKFGVFEQIATGAIDRQLADGRIEKAEAVAAHQRLIEHLMMEESFKRYKAMDKSGQVWRIQNPALLTYQGYLGISPIRDIIRERVSDEELGQNVPTVRGKGKRETVEADL